VSGGLKEIGQTAVWFSLKLHLSTPNKRIAMSFVGLYRMNRAKTFKSVFLNTGSPGLDKEKVAGGMIFGRRSGVKITREAAFDAV
jgi:hypothetical protein